MIELRGAWYTCLLLNSHEGARKQLKEREDCVLEREAVTVNPFGMGELYNEDRLVGLSF